MRWGPNIRQWRSARGPALVAIPDLTRRSAEQAITAWCDGRVPETIRHQLRYEPRAVGTDTIAIAERRPDHRDAEAEWTSFQIARFRWDSETSTWELQWVDQHGTWHPWPELGLVDDIALAIAVVDANPSGCFLG